MEPGYNPKDLSATGKAPLEDVPATILLYASMQMRRGNLKYGRYNYRAAGIKASVYYAALLRHLLDWYNGNDNDEEGVPNLAGLAANAAILIDGVEHGYIVDDRPPRVNMRKTIDAAAAQAVAAKDAYGDRNPVHYSIADPTFISKQAAQCKAPRECPAPTGAAEAPPGPRIRLIATS